MSTPQIISSPSYEHQQTVRRIKSQTERCFEVNPAMSPIRFAWPN